MLGALLARPIGVALDAASIVTVSKERVHSNEDVRQVFE